MKNALLGIVVLLACALPCAPAAAKTRLNNFVTVHLDKEAPKPGRYKFRFKEPGWAFVRVSGAQADTRIELDGIPYEPGSGSGVLSDRGDVREMMRFVTAGKHVVRLTGGAERLEVRRVPEIRFCKFQYDPWVHHDGPYDWAFLERVMLPHVNTVVGVWGSDQSAWAEPWRRRGGRWIIETDAPGWDRRNLEQERRKITAEEVVEGLTEKVGYDQPWIDGQLVNEYFRSLEFVFEPTVEALRRIQQDPRYAGKRIDAYIAGSLKGLEVLLEGGVEAGSHFAIERYNAVQPTEAEAEAHLRHELVETMQDLRDIVPDAQKHVSIALGILSAPPESLDVHPHVDYRVFQDMEFHLLANDPAFDGLAGVMTYTSGYAEEETIRWVARLYRHYLIEGRTDRLSRDPYILPHVGNPDFVGGTAGWELRPASDGQITLRTMEKSGRYAGRYKGGGAGDRWLVMTRGGTGPNTARTRIENLEPGRLYSLRMYSTNLVRRRDQYGNPTLDDISHLDIALEGAEIDGAKSFDHHYRSIKTSRLMYFNYHVRRFRPTGSTVTLAISDWAGPDRRHGNIGRDTAINFVEVRAYLEEP